MSALRATLLALLVASWAGPAGDAGLPAPRPSRHGGGPGEPAASEDLLQQIERAREATSRSRHGEAAAIYREAARQHPGVARWLRLSALQATARSGDLEGARRLSGKLLREGAVPAESARVEVVRAAFAAGREARGIEAAGSVSPAADPALWTSRVVPALLARGDTAAAAAALGSALSAPGVGPEVGERLVGLDAGWRQLERVADSDLREGRDRRGLRLLSRALQAAPPSERPELAARLAEVCLDAGAHGRLRRLSERWLDDESLSRRERARLALARGRSELRRGGDAASRYLSLAAQADVGEPSAYAAFLLADRAHDRGRLPEARRRYAGVAADHPETRYGSLASVRLGTLAFRQARYRDAAGRFRDVRARGPGGAWRQASLYWEARARAELGEAEAAGRLFRRAIERDPVSYYAVKASQRVPADPWSGVLADPAGAVPASAGAAEREARGRAGTGRGRQGSSSAGGLSTGSRTLRPGRGATGSDPAAAASVAALVGRMDLLRRAGWRGRGLMELETAGWWRTAGAGRRLALARRLNASGWTSRGIELAWEVFAQRGGRWSPGLLRAVFPFPYRELVEDAARRHGLEPTFLAAVIRRESGFDAWTVSPAGAVGLAQLMPTTARSLARRAGLAAPDREGLVEPELNLRLGALHLSNLLERFDGSATAALIAYNAGASRYRRWRRFPEFRHEEELFIERIPFAETRRYVKSVHRNLVLYRRLYGEEGRGGAPTRDAES